MGAAVGAAAARVGGGTVDAIFLGDEEREGGEGGVAGTTGVARIGLERGEGREEGRDGAGGGTLTADRENSSSSSSSSSSRLPLIPAGDDRILSLMTMVGMIMVRLCHSSRSHHSSSSSSSSSSNGSHPRPQGPLYLALP